nr:MAG TPA: hypothetical protein [Caudoviricetes sp.]
MQVSSLRPSLRLCTTTIQGFHKLRWRKGGNLRVVNQKLSYSLKLISYLNNINTTIVTSKRTLTNSKSVIGIYVPFTCIQKVRLIIP